MIPVFQSIQEAEIFAEQGVARAPSLCASIYDHRGRSSDPLRRIYHSSLRRKFDPERSARRSAWTGGAFVLAFAIWAIVAVGTDERFLWFYILGLKLFTIGTVLFVRGVGYFLGRGPR